MAAGTAQHYLDRAGRAPECTGTPVVVAQATFQGLVEAHLTAGGVIEDPLVNRFESLVARAITYYQENDPVPAEWEILQVEASFPLAGNARPDLVVRTPRGVMPIDNKWKEKLYQRQGETKDQARNRTLAEYDNTWQGKHYVWTIQQHYKQPCDRYYIALGELGPRPAITCQAFEVSPHRLTRFCVSARALWRQMDELDTAPSPILREAPVHETKYGPCEYLWACMEADLDPTRMSAKYLTIERSPNSGLSTAIAA